MKLHTLLYDFADVIGKVPDIERILVTPTDYGVSFSAKSEPVSKKGVFLLIGKCNEKLEEVDEEFGIPNFDFLKKILHYPNFTRLNVKASIEEIEWSMSNKKLKIESNQGEVIKLGLFANENIGTRISRIRSSKIIDYGVHFRPAKADVEALKYWMDYNKSHLSGDFKLTPEITNRKFYFNVGVCESVSTKMIFADNVNGSLSGLSVYEGDIFYKLTCLQNEVENLVVSFSDQRVCRIKILTACAEYNFYIFALM